MKDVERSEIRLRRDRLKMTNNEKGLTIIELFFVLAVSMLLFAGILTIFRTSFNVWNTSLNNINIQQKGRAAVEEMTRFIRQSSCPVTNITPLPGTSAAAAISFQYMQSTSNIEAMGYFYSSGALYRVSDGSTKTLVESNVDSIYFHHISSYVVRIETFTLTKGVGRNQKTLTFERTINIRNE